MNAFGSRRRASLPLGGRAPLLALQCARNVYQTVDRHMPEAGALAGWLVENAASFALPGNAVPDDDWPERSRRHGVAAADWQKIGTALAKATSYGSDAAEQSGDRWIAAFYAIPDNNQMNQ